MTPQDIKGYFRTGYKFSKITKMSANTMSNWVKLGYVPYASQKKIEKLTNGQLIAEWDENELEKREQ